jgi:hypothetical protein
MPILIRQADLNADREQLVRFCQKNLPIHPDARRFDWLYLNNPFGQARTLTATDDKTGEMVGIASAFPRQFWIQSASQRAWILGDFCISERFRSLGPALTLQRKCLAALPADEIWYDFPSPVMMAVYQRLGVSLFGKQIRHVRPLKMDRKLGRAASYLVQAASALQSLPSRRLPPRSRHIECALHEGAFDREFTELDNDPGTHGLVRGSRTAEYLNWRYRQHSAADCKVITARHEGKLRGYLVIHTNSTEAILSDLLAMDPEATVPSLLAYAIRVLLETDADRLNAPLLSDSALSRYFRRAGFIARETAPVVVETRSHSRSWLLLQGDRES